jgi:hypothetical protein
MSGKLILENTSIKITRASEFNDPFDTFQNLFFEFETSEVTNLFVSKFMELVTNRIPIDVNENNRFGKIVNYIILNHDNQTPDMSGIRKLLEDRQAIVDTILKESNDIWFNYLNENRIFCMSENYDNLLMWSHYADSHKGVVIRFKVIPEIQSAFSAASPVIYSERPPSLGTFDDIFYKTIGAVDQDISELNKKYSLTKSEIWRYEKEWRFTLKQRDPTKNYDLLEIDPREIDGVILGCKIEDEIKNDILIATRKYPEIEIFQAKKNDKGYNLIFENISL